jgi:oxalate decarboxylase/phosphoglucose isomerase-like protein (cupin superfamily)
VDHHHRVEDRRRRSQPTGTVESFLDQQMRVTGAEQQDAPIVPDGVGHLLRNLAEQLTLSFDYLRNQGQDALIVGIEAGIFKGCFQKLIP